MFVFGTNIHTRKNKTMLTLARPITVFGSNKVQGLFLNNEEVLSSLIIDVGEIKKIQIRDTTYIGGLENGTVNKSVQHEGVSCEPLIVNQGFFCIECLKKFTKKGWPIYEMSVTIL
jgi:hypothetical protein